MKDDLNASEKRLIAALDRIDSFIDRSAGLHRNVQSSADGEAVLELTESRAQNQRLSDELAALRASHSSAVSGFEARLRVINERLAEAEQRAAEMAAANAALAEANRHLLGDAPASGDAMRRALEAEIESLRAARQAERGKLGEIIDTLDRMLGVSPVPGLDGVLMPEAGHPAMVEGPMPLDSGMAESDAAELSDATDEQRG